MQDYVLSMFKSAFSVIWPWQSVETQVMEAFPLLLRSLVCGQGRKRRSQWMWTV